MCKARLIIIIVIDEGEPKGSPKKKPITIPKIITKRIVKESRCTTKST